MKRIAQVVATVGVVVATLFITATAAQAYSRAFALNSTDSGWYYGAWGQGTLNTSSDDFSKCSRLWVTSGKLWDEDADGSGAIAWLAYTDCATGEREYFKLGSVGGEGKSTTLTTASVYNAKHPTVSVFQPHVDAW
ncbi:hypothetical protein [Streptomyces sp. NEAU-YJ-81]|uniref:hypothetical protein n=1 Tax=Streptomyces sp. NEAU-YJ-81 TaxID=2820288 RepID=UPI001ABC69EC|nr:hypothetical protein [Streptomyces sp. NEAU-YJ-81]MBO3675712.1 hypothetical protein [Streptomyces sp. NEAU-YJ-81]